MAHVIRIPHIVQSARAWVLRVLARQFASLLPQLAKCLSISSSLGTGNCVPDSLIGRVYSPALSPVALWHENCLDAFVQFVQVDIAEYGAAHSTLRCPA